MGAVRSALFAEAGVKLLIEAKEAAAFSVPSDAPLDLRTEAMRYSLAGKAEVATLRAVLFPEDDDG